NDRGLIGGGKRLVMHAPVQSGEVGRISDPSRRMNDKGIEESNFDVWTRIERSEQWVEPRAVVVVQQQPHADAPIRCGAQGIEQQRTGNIVAPDVVAHIKSSLSGSCQQSPSGERVARVR